MAKNSFYPQGAAALLMWLLLQIEQWKANFAAFGFDEKQGQVIIDRIQALIDRMQAVAKLQATAAEAVKGRDELASEFETWYRAEIQRDRRVEGLPAGLLTAFKWEGTEQAPPNPDTTRPVVGGFHAAPGAIDLDWVRGPFDGVDVDLSYDGQTWAPGGFDNRSPYEDRRPNHAPGTPETRFYRLRFRYKGQPFGQYSDVRQTMAAGS